MTFFFYPKPNFDVAGTRGRHKFIVQLLIITGGIRGVIRISLGGLSMKFSWVEVIRQMMYAYQVMEIWCDFLTLRSGDYLCVSLLYKFQYSIFSQVVGSKLWFFICILNFFGAFFSFICYPGRQEGVDNRKA